MCFYILVHKYTLSVGILLSEHVGLIIFNGDSDNVQVFLVNIINYMLHVLYLNDFIKNI